MTKMYESKFDDGVVALFEHAFSRVGRFPVLVVAAEGCLQRAADTLRGLGDVRFILEPLNAISVWLTLQDIEQVAQLDWVTEIELARETAVAEA